MATVTKSIGTSSRDYSTITLWEADLDDTLIYSSGDDAVGECYNDSTFDEQLTIDGGNTVGLTSTNLTVASGERHDGTAGTGALLFKTSGGSPYYNIRLSLNGVNRITEWLEHQRTGTTFGAISTLSVTASTQGYIRNNICHNVDSGTSGEPGIITLANASTLSLNVTNNIIYSCDHTANNSTQMNGILLSGVGPNSVIANNTVYGIGKTQGTGDCHGIANTSDDSDLSIKNNLSTGTTNSGTGAAKDYETTSLTNTTSATNMSSDATSPETELRNIVASDQFVSTTGGSEDLHLKSGADAIGAATDLAATPDGVQYDINGSNRNALAATVWDIGAHQYASTASVGTSARDYSTITLWEADLDDTTVYGAGANAVGECYNDSDFTESVTIDGGATVGLTSVTLTVADGEKHDGTAGTGVKIVGNYALTVGIASSNIVFTVSYIENSLTSVNTSPMQGVSRSDVNWLRCIVHHSHAAYAGQITSMRINRRGAVMNNIVYGTLVDRDVSLSIGILVNSESDLGYYGYCYNNTIYNVTNTDVSITTGGARGISLNNVDLASHTIAKNNICVDTDTPNDPGFSSDIYFTDTANPAPYNLTSDDTADDSTADNTGALINKVSSNQFVSTVGGSEDLHLKAGADAIGAGEDLAATPDGVQYDINGSNRNALTATVWDIGAHQYAFTASIGTSSRDYSTMVLWEADLDDGTIYGAGASAVGECYNDSTFTAQLDFTITSTDTPGSATLTVADGEGHDGTSGTGVTINTTSSQAIRYRDAHIPLTVNHIELTSSGGSIAIRTNRLGVFKRMLVHNCTGTFATEGGQEPATLMNSFLYSSTFGPNCLGHRNYNNTIYNMTNWGVTNAVAVNGGVIKNTISVGNGGEDFDTATAQNESFCISSDTTASGTGSLTNKTAANLFVSIVGGSEDLHLKSGADAIGAATDLAATPDGVQYDINGSNRNALTATVWDIGGHQYASTASIGTSSRDYSTITLWEADLDDTAVYVAGANAVGECYNDSTFDEYDIVLNGGQTVGLDSVELTVAETERHDGTAGTGAKIDVSEGGLASSGKAVIKGAGLDNRYLKWLEITRSNITHTTPFYGVLYVRYIDSLIIHDIYNTSTSYQGDGIGIASSWSNNYQAIVSNCMVYNIEGARNTSGFSLQRDQDQVLNNTVYNIKRTNASASYNCYGIRVALRSPTIKNCISVGTNAEFGSFGDFTGGGTQEYNLSSDSTASGTGSITSAVTADQFVSIVSGSEDLHLKAGSDAINAGVYLTTPDAIQYDIDGDLRGNFGLFSMGADEFVLVIDNTPDIKSSIIKLKSPSLVQPSYKAGYAKSASESANPNLWDGLVGAWMPTLGVTGGTLRDVSGNRNHGTLTSMDPATDWVTSEKGLALDFDGVNDYITCGDVHDALERFTLSIWFKSANGSQTNKGLFGRWGSSATANSGYMLWLSMTGKLSLPINGAGHAEGTTDIRTGGWRHLVGTFDGVNGKIFVDGKLERSFTDATPNTSSSDFLIGAYLDNSNNFEEVAGTLSFATLYDRAISTQEINQLYRDPLAPFRKRRSVPYRKAIIDPAETLTKLGLTATPFKTFTVTDKGIVVEDANGKQFLMFVF